MALRGRAAHRVEQLEVRQLLAIDASFDKGTLTIVGGAEDDIVLTGVQGWVKVNGQDPATGPLLTLNVQSLDVRPGSKSALVDLDELYTEKFSEVGLVVISEAPKTAAEKLEQFAIQQLGDDWQVYVPLTVDNLDTLSNAEAWPGFYQQYIGDRPFDAIDVPAAEKALNGILMGLGLPTVNGDLIVNAALGESAKSDGIKVSKSLGGDGAAGLGGGVQLLEEGGDGSEGGSVRVVEFETVVDEEHLVDDFRFAKFRVQHDPGDYFDPFGLEVNTVEGSATEGVDYYGAHGSLGWADGQEGEHRDVWVEVMGDNLKEADETFHLEISNLVTPVDGPEGNATISVDSGTATILDGDAQITLHDAQVLEGTGAGGTLMEFTVSLSNPVVYDLNVAVDWDLLAFLVLGEGTATPVFDYSPSGTFVHFEPGETEQTFTVGVVPDSAVEDDEWFPVYLASNLWDYARRDAIGTIIDDDQYIYLSISDAEPVVERDEQPKALSVFTVSMSAPAPEGGYIVAWQTLADSAGYDDFSPTPPPFFGHTTIPEGEMTAEIEIPIEPDLLPEGDELFFVDLVLNESPESPYRLLDPTGLGVIIDDDPFKIKDEQPIEPLVPAFCVMPLSASNFTGDAIVPYETAGGTMLAYSAAGDTRPIVSVDADIPIGPIGYELAGVGAALKFGRLTSEGVLEGESTELMHFSPGDFEGGDPIRLSMQFDAADFDPSVYDWSMQVFYTYEEIGPGADTYVTTRRFDGTRVIVNRPTLYNELAGWSIAELDRLVFETQGDRVAWVRGHGYGAFFEPDGQGGFTTPEGYFETLSFNSVDGTYTLRDPYGNRAVFNSAGELVKRVDRNGNERVYAYVEVDGDPWRELATITDPAGLVTTFQYEQGKLVGIEDYAGRVTEVVIVGDLLSEFRSPDPDGPGGSLPPLVTTMTYAGGLLGRLETPDGLSANLEYDFAGRLTRITHADGTFRALEPLATRALSDPEVFGSIELPAPLFGTDVAVARYTDELGHDSFYKFNRFGYVTEYVDELEHKSTYTRNNDGLLTIYRSEDPDDIAGPRSELVLAYFYDNRYAHRMNLVQVWNASPLASYTYDDEFNLLATSSDPTSGLTEYVRDAVGNLLEIRQASGSIVTEFTYADGTSGPAGLVETVTDPNGNVTRFDYFGATALVETVTYAVGTPIEAQESFLYDPVTLTMTASIDALGRRTDYLYDNLDRLASLFEPDPDLDPVTLENGPLPRPQWTFAYCACGRISTVTDPTFATTLYQYDPLRGWVDAVRVVKFDFSEERVWTYEHDALGRTTAETAPLGRRTEYDYDEASRLVSVLAPAPGGGGAQPEWEFHYDNADLLEFAIDPEGNRTDYGYNGLFQLTKVTLPEPAPGQPRPEWNYQVNSGGLLLRATDPEGRFTEYAYDGAGRLDQVQVGGVGVLTTMLVDYGYDPAGNLRFTTDPAGHVTERVYDARNRLTQLIEPDPDLPGSGQAAPVTLFAYDDANNLKTLTDPAGNATEWFYDGLDRVVEERNELADSRFYEYDAQTRLVSMTDRLGRATQYEHDWLGNVTSETWLDALGVTVRAIDYTYDEANRLETVLDPSGGSYTFTYDGLDRLASTMIFTPGVSGFTGASAAYDALGNRTDLDVYRGFTLEHANDYQYDGLSRLTRVTQSGPAASVAEKRVDFTYNLASQFDTITRYSDLAGTTAVAGTDYDYELLGRLKKITHDPAAVGEPNLTHEWTYDTRHRVASYTNSVDGQVTYNYDHRSQLEGANWTGTPPDETYDYDDAGNRTLDGAATYTVGANNRLESDGVYDYAYDAEGNLVSQVTIATGEEVLYSYDHRNRLTKVTFKDDQGATTEEIKYLYDAFDRRIGRNVDSDGNGTDDRRERTVYDGREAILDFVDPDGAGAAPMALATRYLNGPAVDQILAQEDLSVAISAADRVLWHLADNQGTVRDLVDNEGQVVEHYQYDAFGELVAITDGNGDPVAGDPKTNFLYNGMWFDADVEVYFADHRVYMPSIGRWLQEDPIPFNDGPNNYAFVGNSSTNLADPTGLRGNGYHRPTSQSGRRAPSQLRHGSSPYSQPGGFDPAAHPTSIGGNGYWNPRSGEIPTLEEIAWGARYREWRQAQEAARRERARLQRLQRETAEEEFRLLEQAARRQREADRRAMEECVRSEDQAGFIGPPRPPGSERIERHHSNPRFLGGDRNQPTTDMLRSRHLELHRYLNPYLRAIEDAVGNHMRAQRRNSGRRIQELFSEGRRLEAMAQFYKTNLDRYPDAAYDFFRQHPDLWFTE